MTSTYCTRFHFTSNTRVQQRCMLVWVEARSRALVGSKHWSVTHKFGSQRLRLFPIEQRIMASRQKGWSFVKLLLANVCLSVMFLFSAFLESGWHLETNRTDGFVSMWTPINWCFWCPFHPSAIDRCEALAIYPSLKGVHSPKQLFAQFIGLELSHVCQQSVSGCEALDFWGLCEAVLTTSQTELHIYLWSFIYIS